SNYGDFDRHNRFRRVHGFNKIIFIRGFGFPWWWGLSWGSNWSYYPPGPYEYSEYSPSSYSYPSYYSGYGYGYGNYGYDYGIATRLCFTMAAITAPRTPKMMKVLCAMFSPNTQFAGIV